MGRLEITAVGCGIIFYAGLFFLFWKAPYLLIVPAIVFGGTFLVIQWDKLSQKGRLWVKATITILLVGDLAIRQSQSIPAQIITGTLNGFAKVLANPPTSDPDLDQW